MAKEAIYIQEERVGELIRVLRAGLKALPKTPDGEKPQANGVRRETAAILTRWCKEEERYLREAMHKEYWP